MVKQDRNLFSYTGTHWKELGPSETDKLKQQIQVVANGLLGSRDLEAFYKYILIHAPTVPPGTDLYKPNPFVANFQDGTLHFWKVKGENKYTTEFRPHAREDFLASVLPFKYPQEKQPSPQFDAMLERMYSQNADKDDIVRFIKQAMGACLVPAFPIIVLFTGKPGSGKSTIIKLLVRLLSPENVSSVQMCDMHGFNMETMVGKLVNFDTDIDTNRPMNDSMVKKIIDRIPFRVRRKGRVDVDAFIPAVHLFASNQLPRSLDGSSHAYGRRLIVIRTESWEAPADFERDFEVSLLEAEEQGIISRAVEGFTDLVARGGHYSVPPSSRVEVERLEEESDLLGQFLDEVKHNEVYDSNNKVILDDAARVERKNLWAVFDAWQRECVPGKNHFGKNAFFRSMESRRFGVHKDSKGARQFHGIGVVPKSEGNA